MSEEIQKDDAKSDDGVIRVFIPSNKQTDEIKDETVRLQPDEDVQQTQPSEDGSEEPSEDVRQQEQPGEENGIEGQVLLEEVIDLPAQEETQPQEYQLSQDTQEEQKPEVKIDLPENIEKLVNFINETGGTIEDYVLLNRDVNSLNESQLIKEYYKQTKPHLNDEEIQFLIEDRFSYDETLDDEIDIKRKKLAFKEEASSAKKHLSDMKDRYYAELKAGSKLTQEQQKAVDFFNRYNKEQESVAKISEQQKNIFLKKTDEVFSNDFKGFEYGVGDKKYRFNVKNPNEIKNSQSDINNFVRKFLNKENVIEDAKGYHKALFTAMNADAIANHFYEQGKADAIKESIARSKNVDMQPRSQHEGVSQVGGVQVRAVSGDSSSRLRVKFNK